MKQYKINGKYKKLPSFIYEVIKQDKKWFYSLYSGKKREENYILLRLSRSYLILNTELKERNIKYEILPYDSLYECNMTMKYFNEFVNLFHAESVLIQKTDKKDIKKILERIIHLSHNMAGFNYWDEALNLSHEAVLRSFIAGNLSKNE